jgi:hypothetical protein
MDDETFEREHERAMTDESDFEVARRCPDDIPVEFLPGLRR